MVALTKYTQNEGLSSYFVTKIIRDSYGFMWIGTQEGLNLFDGRDFQIFSKQARVENRLGGSFVIDIAEDKKRNLLWVLTAYGDICGIDLTTRVIKKRIIADKDNQLLSRKWVRSITIQDDILWIAGLNMISAFNIPENSFRTVDMLRKTGMTAADCNISKLSVDNQNRLWIFSDGYGIAVVDKNADLLYQFRSDLADGMAQKKKLRFWNIIYRQDQLYAGTSWGLRVFDINTRSVTLLKKPFRSIIDTAEILSLAFSSPTHIFFSTPNKFYGHDLVSHQTEIYSDHDREDDWLTLTYQTFYDSITQKLWVGTQSGLASFDGSTTPFTIFSRSSGSITRIKHAFSILPLSANEIYCGDENGLFYIHTATKEIEQIDHASSNLLLFKDMRGNIFLSNKSGFYLVKDKKLQPAHLSFPALAKLETDQLSCALQYNDSIILFGSVIQKGLSVWNVRSGELKIFHNDSARHSIRSLSIINNLYKNSSGEAFILTEKSIIRFNPLTEASTVYTVTDKKTKTSFANFMDMCETSDNYWIATYGDGIIEADKNFNSTNSISANDGLSNNCVYKVFPYKDKSIIATTNNGLTILDCKTNSVQKYYQSDGLHSSFFEQVCGVQYEEKIYAGGVNGFTVIDPAILFSNPHPPQFYLNKLICQTRRGTTDTTNIFLDHFIIPNDILQVTISFSGLNYKNPLRTSYAYKISENGGDWISLGSQNFINLPVLSPGRHTLLFKTANEAGVWNDKPLTLVLTYLPKWYQTIWFKLAISILAATFFWGLYQYRLTQIKKQQLIRKNIASDLHDDIGSTLHAVKVFTHLAKKEPHKTEHLNLAEESLTRVTLGLRDIIWVLDDSHDTLFDLMERIKKSALPIANAKDISIECSVVGETAGKQVSKTEKRSLLLIAKEAINNSIKYADCKKITVQLQQNKKNICLTIRDDGKGFDTLANSEGNGLRNIHYRAAQIQYNCSIVSGPEKGTIVEITKK